MYIEKDTLALVSTPDIKKAHPHISFPVNISDELLHELGYARVIEVPPPEGDKVTPGVPIEVGDGNYRQTWEVRDFTPEEISQQLEDAKAIKLETINKARDDAFDDGLPYVIAGESDVVQTRTQDKINLLGLRMEAVELKNAGVTDAVLSFRGLNNVEHLLTPTQMVDMTNAALAYIQGVYKKSWGLKDAVNEASTFEELEAIQW